MPLIQIDLNEEEDARLDAIAKEEKRAKRSQAHVFVMERVSQVEAEKAAEVLRQSLQLHPTDQAPPMPAALAKDLTGGAES